MTQERIIEIMQTEKECVLRQDTDKCDRNCGKCDLVLPTEEVLQAYDAVIRSVENHDTFMKRSYLQGKQDAIEQRSIIKELIEDMREVTPEESKSIEEYLSRTSKKTGVNIFDLLDDKSCEECRNNHTSICGNCKDFDEFEEIDFVQPHKKIPVTLDLTSCEDAVSREAILKKQYRIDDSATLSARDVVNVEDIEDAPSVTVRQSGCEKCAMNGSGSKYCDNCKYKQQTGEWIEHEVEDTCRWLTCSKCGYEWINRKENFCPNCGRRMLFNRSTENHELNKDLDKEEGAE